MNKEEFLSALERELMALPLEERLSALQYYKDYFEDAGKDKEETVIQELGSPRKVAEDILKDYRDVSTQVEQPKAPPINHSLRQTENKSRMWLLVLICLLAVPIGIPLLMTAFGLLIAVVAVVLAFFMVILVLAIAFFLAGCVLIVKGIASIVFSPVSAVFLGGVGMVLVGLGILSGVLFVRMCLSFLPAFLRGFVELCRRPFVRRSEGRA